MVGLATGQAVFMRLTLSRVQKLTPNQRVARPLANH